MLKKELLLEKDTSASHFNELKKKQEAHCTSQKFTERLPVDNTPPQLPRKDIMAHIISLLGDSQLAT